MNKVSRQIIFVIMAVVSAFSPVTLSSGEHSLCLLMCGAVEQNCHNRNDDNIYEYHHDHIQPCLHHSNEA